jgi:hypothetical protein
MATSCRVLATAALALASLAPAHAQWWENVPKGNAPRDAKGEIDLTAPAPWKIVQTDDLIVIVHEAFSLWRQIFMDGRKLGATFNPSWLGYSAGHWEGNTLVVDTRGFNGRAWLDQVGKPSTDKLHVIERYTRKDYGHMDLEVTIDDPGAYTKPWTVKQDVHLLTGTELLEFICNENNKDVVHLSGGNVN